MQIQFSYQIEIPLWIGAGGWRKQWNWAHILGQFHQHLRTIFLHAQDLMLFMAICVQRMVHELGKFQLSFRTNLAALNIGEIEWWFFCQTLCFGNFLLGKKVWWNRPLIFFFNEWRQWLVSIQNCLYSKSYPGVNPTKTWFLCFSDFRF